MTQYDVVIEALQTNGGYATLGQLNHMVLKSTEFKWKGKTPTANIRRIVQERPEIFKIRPGLWGLTAEHDRIMRELGISVGAGVTTPRVEEFNHSYYQGLLVQIGNWRSFRTFIPAQDKNRKFLSHPLHEMATLSEFRPFTYEHLLKRGRTIDVTWFNDRDFPDAFFEVEHSTDIHNSLLKFMEFQDFRTRFVIVADTSRRGEFDGKAAYTAFRPIKDRVEFWDYDRLSDYHTKASVAYAAQESLGF